ncbi:hypothetical protein K0M31_013991 [Melipona bicolor]|uniref:Uncharacterized protein n=1 Tax=Melipona bicolor TaxID=60889 RepID=A0AA40G8V3_9HYME|nr:hypothetical protein K0M31_013991 [Melipona bicolor]
MKESRHQRTKPRFFEDKRSESSSSTTAEPVTERTRHGSCRVHTWNTVRYRPERTIRRRFCCVNMQALLDTEAYQVGLWAGEGDHDAVKSPCTYCRRSILNTRCVDPIACVFGPIFDHDHEGAQDTTTSRISL